MKKQKALIIILIVFIATTLFYWYELRPANIKKACMQKGKEAATETVGTGGGTKDIFHQEVLDTYYRNCTREKGL